MGEKNTLGQISDHLRSRKEDFESNFTQWKADVHEDPSLLWRTPAIRWGLIAILAIAALLAVRFITSGMTTGVAGSWETATDVATVYVACSEADCLWSGSAQVSMAFRDWPMNCSSCAKDTVYRAKLCPKCRKWFATAPGEPTDCPHCRAAAPPPQREKAASRPTDPDEDW